jgi:hypothetical protein
MLLSEIGDGFCCEKGTRTESRRGYAWLLLQLENGPRYNRMNNAPSAQTVRLGLVRPVRELLGGMTSPAALFFMFVDRLC